RIGAAARPVDLSPHDSTRLASGRRARDGGRPTGPPGADRLTAGTVARAVRIRGDEACGPVRRRVPGRPATPARRPAATTAVPVLPRASGDPGVRAHSLPLVCGDGGGHRGNHARAARGTRPRAPTGALPGRAPARAGVRSEEHTSELQSRE